MTDEAFRDGWEKGRAVGFDEGVEAMRDAAAALARDEASATGELDGEVYIARKIADAIVALPVIDPKGSEQ
jgi:hypothetical protein